MSKRIRRLAVLGVVAAVVALGAWLAWTAYSVNRDLSAAVDDADRLRQAVSDGEDGTARAALADLQQHSAEVADRTDGPLWGALGVLPWIGDDADGIALVSDVVADLSRDGLPGLVSASGDLESLLPKDGRIPVAAVRDLRRPVSRGSEAFAEADRRLAAADSSGYVEALRTRFRDLADQVADAADSLGAADTAVAVLPGMLGAEEPQQFLLAFQNNAEVRPTGGLPGAVALIDVNDGAVEMTEQVTGGSLSDGSAPILPLTDEEVALYGQQLGSYFVDATFTPHFPRTAELMRAHWQSRHGGELDGVLMVDTVTLAYLLEATGPVEVDGITLTADNAVETLLHDTYLRLEPEGQDAFFAEVARVVFDRLSSGVGEPGALLDALTRATREGRVLVHSFDESVQTELAGTAVAGELVTDVEVEAPQVGVYLSDTTASKMSWFLDYDVQVDATYCQDGRQGLTGKATLTSTAPPDAAELSEFVTGGGPSKTKPGKQLVAIRVYGPAGGTIKKVMLRSKPLDEFVVEHEGRPVAQVWAELDPGEDIDLTWTMSTARGQTGDPELTVTPGAQPGTESRTVPSACG